MKKLRVTFLALMIPVLLLSGCSRPEEVPAVEQAKSNKIKIVATLFPQYDFARQIAGDKAEVTLLLPPGVESHSYEPTPSDIIKINNSDLFLYTGKNMEAWAQKIIDGMEDSGAKSEVLDVSKGIELDKTEDIESQHHHEGESEAAVSGEEDLHSEHAHEHIFDPHIWTDPLLAKVMVANIEEALCRIDPSNAEYYRKNAAEYSSQLDELDEEFRDIVDHGKRKEIIFGSRFALYYFSKRYGIEYEAAFDSCSSETEPSAKTVADLMEEIRVKQIPVVYYAEIEDPKVAKSIQRETGAKMLLFHSCHNVTKDEWESGETYLSLMHQNALHLKEGLE